MKAAKKTAAPAAKKTAPRKRAVVKKSAVGRRAKKLDAIAATKPAPVKHAAPLGTRIAKSKTHAQDMLTKIGVALKYQHQFMQPLVDGQYQVNIVEAGTAVEEANTGALMTPTGGRSAKKPKRQSKILAERKPLIPARKTHAERKPSCAGDCLAMFLAGKSNKEVWEVINSKWELGDDKAHYPAWYRSHFRRTGKLPKKA